MAWFVAHVMNAIDSTVLEASHRTMMVDMKWSCRIYRVVLGSLVIRMLNGKMQRQIRANRGAYPSPARVFWLSPRRTNSANI